MPHKDRDVKLTAVVISNNPDIRSFPTSFLPDVNNMDHEGETALQESQRISREIDERLMESKKAWDKKKKAPQILLLGTYAMHPISNLATEFLQNAPRTVRIGEGRLFL